MSPFNRLWAQVNAVISCLKSQKDMCLNYLTDDLSSWWESKLKDYEFKLLSVYILYIYRLIMSQLWVKESVRYITYNSYAISVMSPFNNRLNWKLFNYAYIMLTYNTHISVISKLIIFILESSLKSSLTNQSQNS